MFIFLFFLASLGDNGLVKGERLQDKEDNKNEY